MNLEIEIKLEKFEGPMDLLYSLIVKNKIDIYDIPIALITEQYLEYINEMGKYNMENISEFLIMAATLIEIKSRLLLPKEVDENDEEIDPREELVRRLIEYKKFKGIAQEFNVMQKIAGYSYYKESDKELIKKIRKDVPKEISDILNGATADMLFNAFQEVLKRQELRTDKIRSGFNSVQHDEFTLEEKVKQLTSLINTKKRFSFFHIFNGASSKNEIVTTFLAMLQLIKEKKIKIIQEEIFDDITITTYEEVC